MIAALLLAVTIGQMHQCIDEIDSLDEGEHVPTWSGHANPQCTVNVETLATKEGASLVAGWYRWPLSGMEKYSVVTFVACESRRGVRL